MNMIDAKNKQNLFPCEFYCNTFELHKNSDYQQNKKLEKVVHAIN